MCIGKTLDRVIKEDRGLLTCLLSMHQLHICDPHQAGHSRSPPLHCVFTDPCSFRRYASLLEATMEHMPHVCPIEPSELLDFCTESGYTYRLESQGSLLIPPDYNVGMTDWERSIRLRYAGA